MKREDVFNYVKDTYKTEPEYLWEKLPNYAVLRHCTNDKWYAIIMDVDKSKLGLSGSGKEDIIDIKLNPEKVEEFLEFDDFLPAYHMNKKNWVSVRLAKIDKNTLTKLIDRSFELTK